MNLSVPEAELLALDHPGILINLLKQAHASEHPTDTLTSILAFYDVTLEQLQLICGTLHRAHIVSSDHPTKDIVQDILEIFKGSMRPETYKIHLVYVATSIPHLWCKESASVVMLDRHKTIFLPYSKSNTPTEYVWIHFHAQKHTAVTIMHSKASPTICADMLVMDKKRDPHVFCLGQEKTSHVVIRLGSSETLVSGNEKTPEESNTSDYFMLITRGNAFYRLANVVLVQPSKNLVTPFPVCLHKL